MGAEGAWKKSVDRHLAQVDRHLGQVDRHLGQVDRRLSHLEVDVATLKNDVTWIRRVGGVMLTLQLATIAAVLRA